MNTVAQKTFVRRALPRNFANNSHFNPNDSFADGNANIPGLMPDSNTAGAALGGIFNMGPMSKKQKRMLFRVLASAVLFAVALLLPTEGCLRRAMPNRLRQASIRPACQRAC